MASDKKDFKQTESIQSVQKNEISPRELTQSEKMARVDETLRNVGGLDSASQIRAHNEIESVMFGDDRFETK